jgi:bifunctional non-homologous end joining protein LigD
VGETLHVFDLLEYNGEDMRKLGYWKRYKTVSCLLEIAGMDKLRLVGAECQQLGKGVQFEKLKRDPKEGVVFKHLDAPYTAGRPNSGGSQLKYKFCATASFVVGQTNRKRSVSLSLFNAQKLVPAGNVTIPANHDIPPAGAVVECRYLYAFPESGVIYQPVYLGLRDDIAPEECIVSQLKYKAAPEKEAA